MAPPRLGLERGFWTPLLILVTLVLGAGRAALVAPVQQVTESTLEQAAGAGLFLGGVLLPWAFGALAGYVHWFVCRFTRDRAYMQGAYPLARRRVVHATVLVLCLMIASDLLWRIATA